MTTKYIDELNSDQMMRVLIELRNRGYTKEDSLELIETGKWKTILREIVEDIFKRSKINT